MQSGSIYYVMEKYLNMRYISLVILSLQTSILVLLLRYSRTAEGKPYLISVAVLLAEVLKIVLASIMAYFENGGFSGFMKNKAYKAVLNKTEALKLALPAALYVIQNNLLFLALTNLDAATYQVTYQLKILTTAIFAWWMLDKKLVSIHWLSLLLLMAGVSLVQVDEVMKNMDVDEPPNTTESVNDIYHSHEGSNHGRIFSSWFIGIFAVLISCVLSGFSGVYFERILKKGKPVSLGIRNLHLGFFSLIFCSFTLYGDRHLIYDAGLYQGFTATTWIVIAIQSFGGLVVSLTMKYADNILKGFATSISIVVSTVASWAIFGGQLPSLQFVIGASMVIGATFTYGSTPIPTVPSESSKKVDVLEL